MFSQLGPLFKTTFRQAESNDTRQKIPHEERDPPQRDKDDKEEKIDDDVLWQDSTTVSIAALRNFLINFLNTMPEAQIIDQSMDPNFETSDIDEVHVPQVNRPKERERPTNTHNAKAVRAYQAIANKTQEGRANTPQTQSGPTYRKPPSADQIENKELRDIYQLIDNLEILSNKGVQDITIQKNGSFVESLQSSVKALL